MATALHIAEKIIFVHFSYQKNHIRRITVKRIIWNHSNHISNFKIPVDSMTLLDRQRFSGSISVLVKDILSAYAEPVQRAGTHIDYRYDRKACSVAVSI